MNDVALLLTVQMTKRKLHYRLLISDIQTSDKSKLWMCLSIISSYYESAYRKYRDYKGAY